MTAAVKVLVIGGYGVFVGRLIQNDGWLLRD